MRMRLRVPSGSTRGKNRQVCPDEVPGSVCARIRKASHMGAEKNHLWPVTANAGPHALSPMATASVVLLRTSEPPCFSVMPMPMVTARLACTGARPAW